MYRPDNIFVVELPHGVLNDDYSIEKVNMRCLNGYDELALVATEKIPSIIRTTNLLARIISLGKSEITELNDIKDNNKYESDKLRDIISHFTLGDLATLMLHLRKLTFGEKMQCIIVCPSCKESMSFDLSVSDLLSSKNVAKQLLKVRNEIHMDNFTIMVRPLTGADLKVLFERL